MDKAKVRKYLEVIRKAVSLIEETLGEETIEIEEFVEQTPPPKAIVEDAAVTGHRAARKKHIGDLMAIDCWPPAVHECLVGKQASPKDQMNRATAVLQMMVNRSMKDLDVLDFGCGEGWVSNEMVLRGAKHVTGYDIVRSETWVNFPQVEFVTEAGLLKQYDMIFLIDVLDHCANPMAVMNSVRAMLKPEGTVFVRCHPWTSKHASHLFKQGLNKSYIHLFLTEEEIKGLGYEPIFTRPDLNPFVSYKTWFEKFKVERERRLDEPLHDFFKVPAFVELLASEQRLPKNRIESFLTDMETNFVDYQLS
jgi:SAM-dependent methyltransferase